MQINGKVGFVPVRILDKRRLQANSKIFEMELEWPLFKEDPLPGQFILIKISNDELPIPISVAGFNLDRITLFIKVVGAGTENITRRKANTRIDIAGPFGKGIDLKPEKNRLLIGGSIGSAPLFFIAKIIESEPGYVSAILGAKDRNEMLADPFFSLKINVSTITDKDGFVTSLMQKEIDNIRHNFGNDELEIIACGPWPMLKEAAKIAVANNIPCQVILDEMIVCGVGSCRSCAIRLKGGRYVQLCQEGPVMDGDLIDWDSAKEKIGVTFPERKIVVIPGKADPLSVTLLGQEGRKIFLRFPFMNASKGIGIAAIKKGYVKIDYLGAYVTESITFHSKEGNPPKRICEIPGGMMNAIGLQNKGVYAFISEDLPFLESLGITIIVSIAGNNIEDFVRVASALAMHESPSMSALEINISCPNNRQVHKEIFAVSPEETYAVISAVRKVSKTLFLFAKVSPAASNIVTIGQAAVDAGADAISGINTLLGSDVDVRTMKTKITTGMGGISGPAIRHLAYRCFSQLYQANLGVPLAGGGGINDAESAFKMNLFGANVTTACTDLYINPNLPKEIHDGLLEYLKYHQVDQLQELVGKAKLD